MSRKLPLSVIILAAGQGKRMKSALPKVLQPLAGRPLLKHVIDTARALEPAAIHVVYGYGGEQVRAALASEEVYWSLQAEQLGTGHAVMQAAPQLPDDHLALILYGDVPLIARSTLEQLAALAGPKALALLTMRLDDPSGYGRVVRSRGKVMRIVEQKDASRKELAISECNTGVMALPAARLKAWLTRLSNHNAQGEYYLTDIIALAVKDRVPVVPLVASTVTEVLGVNDKVQLAELETAYRRLRARELMLEGVTIADPTRFDVRGTVNAGRDVFIDVNVILEGKVILGEGVRVGPNCVIRDCSIGAGTEVLANCVLDGAEIAADCRIGPFTRMRPRARLERRVHVGNFVEVKNSSLGEGSKSNHLTYLGDTVVGKAVNVGAGTVTCNYDGVNKSQTEIGDGAFIGSGSMLVAPVRIGAGATIGAGSTITKNAPDNELTLTRAKQTTIPGWKRPAKKTPG